MTIFFAGLVVGFLIGFLAGFVLSVFAWPKLRQILNGVESEIDGLRAKAHALEAKLRER
jgi:F0F1-type ATP synthase membrane subunit b/b'